MTIALYSPTNSFKLFYSREVIIDFVEAESTLSDKFNVIERGMKSIKYQYYQKQKESRQGV